MELIKDYSARVIETIREQAVEGPRTYGFEYEFLPETPLSLDIMEEIYKFLPSCGFLPEGDCFMSSSGVYLTFEPGGQIEYHSTPMPGWEEGRFREAISLFRDTNRAILEEVGVNYLGVGYLPGRGRAPLCLTSSRYQNLHARMKHSGTRGQEMMKGTASIHLHVGIRHVRELVPIFQRALRALLYPGIRDVSGSQRYLGQHRSGPVWKCRMQRWKICRSGGADQQYRRVCGGGRYSKRKYPFHRKGRRVL